MRNIKLIECGISWIAVNKECQDEVKLKLVLFLVEQLSKNSGQSLFLIRIVLNRVYSEGWLDDLETDKSVDLILQ